MIDWHHFTPISSLLGGALIGLAAVVLLWTNGRVLGISGLLAALFQKSGWQLWRLAVLGGILIAPALYLLLGGDIPEAAPRQIPLLIIAGLLVGFGSRLGGGCTSGHGVCGISRLSLRSMVATLSFMLAGFATVYVLRHVFHLI